MSHWYRWPENQKNNRLPWFTTLRRLLVLPFLFAGFALCWLSLLIGFGLRYANDFLRTKP